MILKTIFLISIGSLLVIIQSVFLADILPLGLVPDIALILIVAMAWRNGSLLGVICGFSIGLTSDTLGLAPLGMHAFIFTLTGYIFGRLRGNIGSGGLILPIIAVIIATSIKYTGAYILGWLLQLDTRIDRIFSIQILYEAGLNAIIAPIFFYIFSLFSRILEGPRRGFQ